MFSSVRSYLEKTKNEKKGGQYVEEIELDFRKEGQKNSPRDETGLAASAPTVDARGLGIKSRPSALVAGVLFEPRRNAAKKGQREDALGRAKDGKC